MEDNQDLYPVELDLNTSTFTAGGHTYFVEDGLSLSVNRGQWLEKFAIYGLLGRQASVMLTELRRAFDLLGKDKKGEVFVLLDNIMRSCVSIETEASPLYYICTLFINREGEDRKEYSLEDANRKIEDWQTLGEVFFKKKAFNYISVTEELWSMSTQNTFPVAIPNLNPLTQQHPSPSESS